MKKRMKQLVALGVAMLLVLGGCGKEPEEPVVVETPEIEVEEVTEAEELPAEEMVEETIPLSVNINTNNKTYYFEGGEDAYLYLQYCDVTVEGDEYENLKRNIENWSLERSEGLRSLYASFEESASQDAEDHEEFYGYSLYQTVSTARIDERIVSLLDDTYQYTGGAHGMFYREGVNFDAASGKKLALQDIFSDYENFTEVATERIIYHLNENYGEELFDEYIKTVEKMWLDDMEPEWYLDGSGIVVVLQEYSVGPYSIGTPEIHLPYAEFEQYIKEAYLPDASEGVARFEKNQEIFLELSGAEEIPMMLQYDWQEEDIPSCSLWLGENEKSIEIFAALDQAYLVKCREETFCMIQVDMGSDDYVTYIYRLTDGVIEEIAEIDASIDAGNINTYGIVMESWINLLGTYGGVKTYHFDENGGFSTEDTEYVLKRNEFLLTTTVDLPVTLDEAPSTLPAGSHIILNATDNETYVTFTIQETGQTGVLEIQRDTNDYFTISINGMNENDCFEVLPYAG